MTKVEVGEKEIQELAEFVSGLRVSPERSFWFIGRYVEEGNEQTPMLAESLRGDLDEQTGTWNPSSVERQPCCEHIVPTSENPFVLLKHCESVEHVLSLIGGMDKNALEREYQYMLDSVYESLTGKWSV